MKYKVKTSFKDKNTDIRHIKGSFYETEDEERAIFLIQNDYLELNEIKDDRVESDQNISLKVILNKTVTEIEKLVTDNYEKETLEKLLQLEEENENRKGVIKHIESILND